MEAYVPKFEPNTDYDDFYDLVYHIMEILALKANLSGTCYRRNSVHSLKDSYLLSFPLGS